MVGASGGGGWGTEHHVLHPQEDIARGRPVPPRPFIPLSLSWLISEVRRMLLALLTFGLKDGLL